MSTTTKILLYDLDDKLQKIFLDLIEFKGNDETLYESLTSINVEGMSGDTKEVIQDLIDAYNNDFKGAASERIRNLEEQITQLRSEIILETLDQGNFDETFSYDSDGNVTLHTVTGDRNYSVRYNYKNDGSGELTTSVKEFTDSEGNAVKITKTYTYTSGDITGISTSTSITPPAE